MAAVPVRERPASVAEAAALLRELGQARRRVCLSGGATKLGWLPASGEVEVSTLGLGRIIQHNSGDFTAVVQAGVPLGELQATLAQAGQMLALDPPLGDGDAATVGGVVASGDCGPLRHRYGGARDLVLGVQVALSDGTVARSGGRVIKNVAGYDLGKLFTGSLGTLGLICEIALRLHPRPRRTATLRAWAGRAQPLAAAAARLAALPLEAECLDVSWRDGTGALLVRFGGTRAAERAASAREAVAAGALAEAEIVEDDEPLWASQRARQRSAAGPVVKTAGVISDLAAVLEAGQALGAGVVSRAGLGLSWLALGGGAEAAEAVSELRRRLPALTLVVQDGAQGLAEAQPRPPAAAAEVMERIKARFDPAAIFPSGAWAA